MVNIPYELARFIYNQKIFTIPAPAQSFEGKTVIVTGANTGLGFETAKWFVKLKATKVILACRSLPKAEAAKESIVASTNCSPETIELWELDLESYESVKAFAARAQNLQRLDVVIENAGIATQIHRLAEGHESSITVNVVSPFLLALLLIPKQRETAKKFKTVPHQSVVSSGLHALVSFPEQDSSNVFEALDENNPKSMQERYNVTKLLQVLAVRKIAAALSSTPSGSPIVFNSVEPGLCHSNLVKKEGGWAVSIFKFLFARTAEEGSKNFVLAAGMGPETHGRYIAHGVVEQESEFVYSEKGAVVEKQVWVELSHILERIQPGILKNLD